MLFDLTPLLDEQSCYDFLLEVLHPSGLACPHGHPLPADQAPHKWRQHGQRPVYRCRACGAVFQLFTGTLFTKSRTSCRVIVLILRGIAQGTPSQHLARELGVDRRHLLDRRHAIQALLLQRLPPLRPGRPRDRGRRSVPQCGREGAPPLQSLRPTPAARQQA